MAGDWIKIEHSLPTKPEVMRLAEVLGVDEMAVVGHLVCFWSWVDQNMSGSCPVARGTKTGLDRVAGRTGFAEAMVEVGWLTLTDGRIEIPNYEHHLSQSAKARALEARRKKASRTNVPRASGQMSGSQPDKNRTREEKRREEKKYPQSTSTQRASQGGGVDSFRNLKDSDLTDDEKLVARFRQAVDAGFLTDSEANRVRFIAEAEHCLTHGDKPASMFARNVRAGLTNTITDADEDRGRARLKRMRASKVNGAVAALAGKLGVPHD